MRSLRPALLGLALTASQLSPALADPGQFTIVNASDGPIALNENFATPCRPDGGFENDIQPGMDFAQTHLSSRASMHWACTGPQAGAGTMNAVYQNQQVCAFHWNGSHLVLDGDPQTVCVLSRDDAGNDVLTISPH